MTLSSIFSGQNNPSVWRWIQHTEISWLSHVCLISKVTWIFQFLRFFLRLGNWKLWYGLSSLRGLTSRKSFNLWLLITFRCERIAISRHFRSLKRKTETTIIYLNTPQNEGKLTSETTFGHFKVVFRPLIRTKPSNRGMWSLGLGQSLPLSPNCLIILRHILLSQWLSKFSWKTW